MQGGGAGKRRREVAAETRLISFVESANEEAIEGIVEELRKSPEVIGLVAGMLKGGKFKGAIEKVNAGSPCASSPPTTCRPVGFAAFLLKTACASWCLSSESKKHTNPTKSNVGFRWICVFL